ncbi:MAG TPA: hypothetical protein VNT99_03330 [Methylomirabilota bacterium]|nr:hypothetical protein [Methylomirabilota bacterium]
MCCKPFTRTRYLANFVPLLIVLALLAPFAHVFGATLEWDANPETNVVGYRVYVGTQSREYSTLSDVGLATFKTIDSLQPEQPYFFAVTAYDSDGLESDFSDEVTYTLHQELMTATPLTDATVCAGGLASFATTVAGPGLFGCVWKKDGAVIDGATNASLTVWAVHASDAGTYTVEVSGAVNAVTNSAQLAVNEPTTATGPAHVIVHAGELASFVTTVAGMGPFEFVWTNDGALIDGATNALFTIPTVSPTNAGAYTVEVRGACNTVTNAALLTVLMDETNALPVPLRITVLDIASPVAISFLGEGGRQYVVQASADMQSWQTINAVTSWTNGMNQWLDAGAPNQPIRFYRVLGSRQ